MQIKSINFNHSKCVKKVRLNSEKNAKFAFEIDLTT